MEQDVDEIKRVEYQDGREFHEVMDMLKFPNNVKFKLQTQFTNAQCVTKFIALDFHLKTYNRVCEVYLVKESQGVALYAFKCKAKEACHTLDAIWNVANDAFWADSYIIGVRIAVTLDMASEDVIVQTKQSVTNLMKILSKGLLICEEPSVTARNSISD